VEYWHPDHFKSIWRTCQDDGQSLMLCHKSRPEEGVQIPCAGYVIVVKYESVGVRIAASFGRLNPDDFSSDEPLYANFEEMMRANNIEPPPRNRMTAQPTRNKGEPDGP
jgi:hypothetical protein